MLSYIVNALYILNNGFKEYVGVSSEGKGIFVIPLAALVKPISYYYWLCI